MTHDSQRNTVGVLECPVGDGDYRLEFQSQFCLDLVLLDAATDDHQQPPIDELAKLAAEAVPLWSSVFVRCKGLQYFSQCHARTPDPLLAEILTKRVPDQHVVDEDRLVDFLSRRPTSIIRD